jgi:hypothetical protein
MLLKLLMPIQVPLLPPLLQADPIALPLLLLLLLLLRESFCCCLLLLLVPLLWS